MSDWQSPDTAQAALRGLCPRCGTHGLFRGVVSFSPSCRTCGLDYGQFNVGDGPAAFLIMIVGALVSTAAITLELNARPAFWVHILVWVPVTTVLVIALLRLAKGLLLILEYKNQAREGRLG